MKFSKVFVFLMISCTISIADSIPDSQLFMNVLKGTDGESFKIPEWAPFKLMPITGWGEVRFPSSEQNLDEDNIILEGAFEQGMVLVKFSEKSFFQTFAKLNYTMDSEEFDWNNKAMLDVGIKFNYAVNEKFAIDFGTKYEWDHRPETERTMKGFIVFGDWFANWSLDSSSRYPGHTWGGVRYPGSLEIQDEDNLILEGAMEQGVDWYSFGGVTINSFVRFAYTLDTEGYEWNNHVTYGIGSKLKIPAVKTIATQVGFRVNQDRRLESGRTENQIISFLNWFF